MVADNAEAEQLERAEKVRYGSKIGRDTATRQRTLYAMELSSSTRDALLRCALSSVSFLEEKKFVEYKIIFLILTCEISRYHSKD